MLRAVKPQSGETDVNKKMIERYILYGAGAIALGIRFESHQCAFDFSYSVRKTYLRIDHKRPLAFGDETTNAEFG